MSSVDYVLYWPETGEVVATGSCPEADVSLQGFGQGLSPLAVAGPMADMTSVWVVEGKVALRPEMPVDLPDSATVGKAAAISCPKGAAVEVLVRDRSGAEIARHSGTSEDGVLGLEANAPGLVEITLRRWPYLDWQGFVRFAP